MSIKTLIVLAAGMGRRYGGLKQLDPVGPSGETILEYSVFDAERAGFDKAVFVIRREFAEPFKEMAAERFGGRIAVEFAFQDLADLPSGFTVPSGRTKPWGTTHAVLAAERAVSTPFAVINADDFYGAESFAALASKLDSSSGEYAMVGFRLLETLSDSGAVARGLCQVDQGGLLESIVELTNVERNGDAAMTTDPSGSVSILAANGMVSMNMWGFTPEVFDQLREQFERFLEKQGGDVNAECYLPNSVNELIRTGQARVRVLDTSARWFGVTYREDRAKVVEGIRRLVASGAYPARLWA